MSAAWYYAIRSLPVRRALLAAYRGDLNAACPVRHRGQMVWVGLDGPALYHTDRAVQALLRYGVLKLVQAGRARITGTGRWIVRHKLNQAEPGLAARGLA